MATKLTAMSRKFKIGRLVLDDPNPDYSLTQVLETHVPDYPQLRHTQVFDMDGVPELIDGVMCLVFAYQLPPIKING